MILRIEHIPRIGYCLDAVVGNHAKNVGIYQSEAEALRVKRQWQQQLYGAWTTSPQPARAPNPATQSGG